MSIVEERQIAKFDFTLQLEAGNDVRSICNIRNRVQNIVQTLHRCASAFQKIHDPAECNHRPGQPYQKEQERDKIAVSDRTADDLPAAKPQHKDHGEPAGAHHHGIEDAGCPIEFVIPLHQNFVQTFELADFLFFLNEG